MEFANEEEKMVWELYRAPGQLPRSSASETQNHLEDEDSSDASVNGQPIQDAIKQIQRCSNRRQFTLDRLLPDDLANAVSLLTQPDSADALTAALVLLCGYSGLLKIGTRVAHAYDYSVPANLFLGLVGPSGVAKTPLLRKLVTAPAADVRRDSKDHHQKRLVEWAEVCRAIPKGEEKPPKPRELFPHLNNYSSEALDLWLQEYEKPGLGVLLMRDELSGMLQAIDADAKSGRGNAEAQLLELFDGTGSTAIRIKDDARSYEKCHVSLIGGVQPEKLRQLIGGKDATGKFARFLMVKLPLVPLTLRDSDPSEEELREFDFAKQMLKEYANTLYRLPPRTYPLSQEARKLYNCWFEKHQREALAIDHPVLSSMLNKTGAHALRLSGLFHLIHTKGSNEPIPPELMLLATEIVDQVTHETRQLHKGGASEAERFVRFIHSLSWNNGHARAVDWQLAKAKGSTSFRGAGSNGFKEAVSALEAMHLGEVLNEGRRGAIKYLARKEMAA